jgi:membrane protein DedA with SNARE-associated domain
VQADSTLEELRRRRRKLRVLVAPLVLYLLAMGVGVALAPALLERAPVLLFLLAPLGRHLVLISPALDWPTFLLVGTAGYFLVDPFVYKVGREYGDAALTWIERRSGLMGRWARWIERLFHRAAWLVLFLSPGPFVNLLAGASGMKVMPWLPLNLGGTLMTVLLTRLFGEALARPIAIAREFVEQNVGALTLASVALVIVSMIVQRRRMRRLSKLTETVVAPVSVPAPASDARRSTPLA